MNMWLLFFLLGLGLAFQGTEGSNLNGGKRTCIGSQGKFLKREGCLIETCNGGFVKESFAEECLEMIEKIIADKLEKKLAEKGCSSDEQVHADIPNVMYIGKMALELPSFTPLSNCSIPKYPEDRLEHAVTGVIDGKIMSCGGSNRNYAKLSSCHMLDGSTWREQPSMKYVRWGAAASMSNEGWMVTGGYDSGYREVKETEIFADGSWKEGVRLPWAFSGHCQVTSKSGVIVAGYNRDTAVDSEDHGSVGSLIVGRLEAGQWKTLSSKYTRMRYYHSCELIGEEKLLIMGGNHYRNTMNIFDLKSNTWKKGPKIPVGMYGGHSTIYKDDLYIIDNMYNGSVYSIPVTMQGGWNEVTKLGRTSDREVHPAPVVKLNQLGC